VTTPGSKLELDNRSGETGSAPCAFPLTFAQLSLWFLDQLAPNQSSYLVPWSIRVTGALDVLALEKSLNEVVRRHEILRTRFPAIDGEPVQIIAPPRYFRLSEIDLSQRSDKAEEAQRLIREEAERPMDLQRGPLLRSCLLRMGAAEHILLLTMHHISFDGWSRSIWMREMARLYEGLKQGKPADLPELPIQYADYAVWQREQLQGERLAAELQFWRTELEGAPATLELPTDRPRPAVQRYSGTSKTVRWGDELNTGLRELGRSEGATLFMTLLAGFQILLGRYSGQQDIVVGTPMANRNRAELEGLIGYFANTVVMRTKLDGDPTFRELLRQVKRRALAAYAHQEMPFEKLVEELHPERSLSHNPIFQVMFSLRNAPQAEMNFSDLALEYVGGAADKAKFDLSFFLVEEGSNLACRVEYDTDLFDGDRIERMLGHYKVLLGAAARDPEQRIGQLPLMEEEEQRELVEEWNKTEMESGGGRCCLHEQFEEQVERNQDAIAVMYGEQRLTYGELNRRANQLAHYLRERGVGRGQRVGLYVRRSLEMMVGLLGIQKSGAAYVPLDPGYPAERIKLTLEQAQVPVLVIGESLLEEMAEYNGEVLCLDGERANLERQSPSNPVSEVSGEDLVYVIFTSGSTGKPKGVEVRHRNVVNLLHWMAKELEMGTGDVFPALASFAFDMSIPELYLGLTTGGKVAIGDQHLAANGEELAQFLKLHQATIVHATPTTWSLLLEAGFTGAGLKRAIGAEPLPQALFRRLMEADSSLYNFYGPTETTVWSTYHRFRSPEEPIVVGRPLGNTQVYILDENGKVCPVGVRGELHIGGAGVAQGYLNRPEQTAEKFIPDPFSKRPAARLYRTGDLARYFSDGRIEFQGRLDHQVKMRGYRIELGEIEAVLSRHPSVADSVVIAREDVPGNKRLVAYVVPAGESVDVVELRAWIKERLPEYMIPTGWVELSQLPLGPNGKVDRKNLPVPDYRRGETEERYRTAQTPTEEIIAGIWGEVLRLDRVGAGENFFELGGHSLLATQVVSRIRLAFRIDLPLRTLFESPTVSELAKRIVALHPQERGSIAPPLLKIDRSAAMPLSFGQQRLWFLDQLDPNTSSYNLPYTVRLRGNLQSAMLEHAINEMVARHEALRTTFRMGADSEPLQVIVPELKIPLPITDLAFLPKDEREETARLMVEEHVSRPFDLMRGPLLRTELIRLEDSEHVFVISTHHIVSDAWSLGVMWTELAALYDAALKRDSALLEELPIQYADYAAWQRKRLTGKVLEEQVSYWKEKMAGAPESIDLPIDRPRPPVQSFRGAKTVAVLPKELLEGLRRLSQQEGVTLFMTALAAFDVLLCRYARQENIVVGSPIAGRTQRETENLIGFFVNTLVLHTDLSGKPTFRQLLHRVRETALGAYANQDVPFEKLVEELNPVRDRSRSPLFQVMLVLQNVSQGDRSVLGNVEVSVFDSGRTSAKFELLLSMTEQRDGLRCALQYNSDLFDRATIERMLEHYGLLLNAAVKDPSQRIADMPSMSPSECTRLLETFNATGIDFQRNLRLHDFFEQKAEEIPQAIALVHERQQLTYSELNARANQLARHLQALGVRADTLVGICLTRSLNMVIAMIAVLKAGGAYIPLDPDYPAERIAFMLEDSGKPVLITEEQLVASLPRYATEKVVLLDRDSIKIRQHSASTPACTVTAANLAYVIYTSGSTGRPKGVMIPHRAVVNFMESMRREPGLEENDIMLAVTTLSFDIAELELWLPLCVGARVVIASREAASDGERLIGLLRTSGATVMQATPATWRLLLEAGWSGDNHLKVLCGGEALSSRLAGELLPKCGSLWNMYGPTETTIWSCLSRVETGSAICLGRPIANTQAYILDDDGQPCPLGVRGELYLGGDGLACGYLNRPELTAEKFVTDRLSKRPGAKLYRTGDLVRYLPDGRIEFQGRLDNQVKVRGYRIELGEIESVLSLHPGVANCVVVAREDVPGNRRLVAYIVGSTGAGELSRDELRAHLRQKLPEYMVPSDFALLNALPLTPNGKIDRKNLPVPDQRHLQAKGSDPRTLTEMRLAFSAKTISLI
jgi:amino acid adenylation domain-containing protein